MKKSEIALKTDTELFALFGHYTVQLVKEANSVRGETKKTGREYQWIVDECVKRFNLDADVLIEQRIY